MKVKLKLVIEGLLLAVGKPLSVERIAEIFEEHERPTNNEIEAALAEISEDCSDRGFELKRIASGYRLQVRQELSEWVERLWDEKPQRYTRALLETLSLIAYRQPITRGDIEEIRGVGVSSIIVKTLLEREWVRVVGHRDVPGRPAMYATTKQFLDYFNLQNLDELPALSEIRDLDKVNQQLELDSAFSGMRVLDLPSEDELQRLQDEEQMDPVSDEELLDEEEAIALAKKPLDEILDFGLPQDDEPDESEDEDDGEGEGEEDRTLQEQVSLSAELDFAEAELAPVEDISLELDQWGSEVEKEVVLEDDFTEQASPSGESS